MQQTPPSMLVTVFCWRLFLSGHEILFVPVEAEEPLLVEHQMCQLPIRVCKVAIVPEAIKHHPESPLCFLTKVELPMISELCWFNPVSFCEGLQGVDDFKKNMRMRSDGKKVVPSGPMPAEWSQEREATNTSRASWTGLDLTWLIHLFFLP